MKVKLTHAELRAQERKGWRVTEYVSFEGRTSANLVGPQHMKGKRRRPQLRTVEVTG